MESLIALLTKESARLRDRLFPDGETVLLPYSFWLGAAATISDLTAFFLEWEQEGDL